MTCTDRLTECINFGTFIFVESKKISAVFYQSASGTMPVREWLMALSKSDRQTVGSDIRTVEFWWPVGMPICRPLAQGLYEVRSRLKDTIARVLFTIKGAHMVLLHAFIKKSQQTPPAELALARKRKTEVEQRS